MDPSPEGAVTRYPDDVVGATPGLRRLMNVLGAPIDILTSEQAVARISAWAQLQESRVVCTCNVHSVVLSTRDAAFKRVIVEADMATPDGAPVAWMLRRQGAAGQRRVCGPDLMLDYCAHAAASGESIFLYGASAPTLEALQVRLRERWPALRIAGAIAPPFRELSPQEDEADIRAINASGAGTVWVSLGCPKQERWMAAHAGRVQAVMVGVGAAFNFHSGRVARAPAIMRNAGLEWLHRLASDPLRLWRRYLVTNTLFLVAVLRQFITRR